MTLVVPDVSFDVDDGTRLATETKVFDSACDGTSTRSAGFYPVARQTKAAVRNHQPESLKKSPRRHAEKQPDSLREYCGISYIAESRDAASFDRSMTTVSDVITEQPDWTVCNENQNNNSFDNYMDHLEELTPTTEPILSFRTSRSNYKRFNNILEAVNTQQSANTHHPVATTHEAVVDMFKPMQTRQQTRLKRKRKMSPEKKIAKKKQEYFLVPLNYGRYGEIMQRGPNGKAKYTDVANVINQGIIAHKNINTFTASKHTCLATLESSKLWTTEKHLYYVKPVLVGTVHLQDLMHKAGERQLFGESEAKFLCGNLLLAAHFLHENGIIHGSITPAKIVFNEKGYALLGYFGTAEGVRQRHSRPRETLPIEYTSPEQLRTKLFANTDVFAIAVITYEMIFGRVPHQGESYSKTRRNIENLEFAPDFDRDKLSSPGKKFLKRCLRWFHDIDEHLMFMQQLSSPLKMMVKTSSDVGTNVRCSETELSQFNDLRLSLSELRQSLLGVQNLREELERDTKSRVEEINLAALHIATDTGRAPLCTFLDNLNRSRESYNTNNNAPVNDDEVKNPVSSKTQSPLLSASSAPLLERPKSARTFKTRLPKKKKGGEKSPKKGKKEYVLVPLVTGVFGDVLQKKPNGKPKYTDVATIISKGASQHKNVDTTTAARYERDATLESHCKRLYYVKPLWEDFITLQDLMKPKKGRQLFSETQARFVCANLLLAAEFLHENDIAHGGIMPKKIVFNDKYYPQIAYFRTAEILTERIGRFRERMPLEYTPPEQCYEDIYENTDIFSIAVVVYEMIFGRTPHHGKNDFETRRNLLTYSFTPHFDNSKLSASGQKFLKHCLRKSERKRFNLLDLKRRLFTSVPWFEDLDEDKMFEQTFPSPLKTKIHTLKKGLKKESEHDRTTDKTSEETNG